MAQDKDFIGEYRVAQKNRKDSAVRIEKQKGGKPEPKSLLKRLFFSRKYNNSLVEKLSSGDLTIEQMKQIKNAIKSGLSDKQIDSLINSGKNEKAMAAIIDIAIVLKNRN